MIRVGLKSAAVLPLQRDLSAIESENRTPEVSYGAPIFLPRLQQVDLTMNVQTQTVDADDWSDIITQCSGCTGTLTRDSLSPEEAGILLNEKKVDGLNVSTKYDDPGYFALAFKSKLSGTGAEGKYLYMMVLKTKFSVSDFSAQSSGNETLTPQPDALSFTSTNRSCDDAWRFYALSNDPNFDATFFSQETAQKLANAAVQTYTNPVSEVVFADSLPSDGQAGKVYIVANKSYYWNGSEMVENGSAA